MNSSEIENGISYIYRHDKKLAAIIDIAGPYKLEVRKDYYHSLLRSIIGQQLSTTAAKSIINKFNTHFKHKPLPADVLQTSDLELRNLGLSYAKIKYAKDLSEKVVSKQLKLNRLAKLEDNEVISELTKVKGIGVWTVHMFLIFTLVRTNILPVSDLGIRKAIMKNYRLRSLPDPKKILSISKKNKWAPYNSIASWYLWRSLELTD